MKAQQRRYLYRIGQATLALLIVLGVLDGQYEAAILLVFNALLGLADANVPTDE